MCSASKGTVRNKLHWSATMMQRWKILTCCFLCDGSHNSTKFQGGRFYNFNSDDFRSQNLQTRLNRVTPKVYWRKDFSPAESEDESWVIRLRLQTLIHPTNLHRLTFKLFWLPTLFLLMSLSRNPFVLRKHISLILHAQIMLFQFSRLDHFMQFHQTCLRWRTRG